MVKSISFPHNTNIDCTKEKNGINNDRNSIGINNLIDLSLNNLDNLITNKNKKTKLKKESENKIISTDNSLNLNSSIECQNKFNLSEK